ncbi:uncharacterized protein TRAVEDRAFT_24247 [Trametes versicolor FP-101664 SS1]|uniref:uncharacterized protein n=1 Tax=Trametes versicolor (strain FP-101664) TaxID=717944 RepID=UPI0004622AB7|nr:uncharacterized protein TRAVEDRAFT_24247 [Trametes versicolor FP-101664 SS1]EIW52859.1 hypothetical protein TRAVEDRAFT_24247 [Trametes versicolor FP-101664 SS1]
MTVDGSASHRVLGCPELLSLVLESFSVSDLLEDTVLNSKQDRRVHRATLASCARVCRTFTGQALDVLWNTLDHLLPLLCIFPTFRRVEAYSLFVGDLDEGWLRFQQYARRVRNLKYRANGLIHPSVWTLLARRNDGPCLLPNLQKLSAMKISLPDVAPITLLFSPNLRSVHLAFKDDARPTSSKALSFIATALFDDLVKNAGPRLEELCLFPRFPLVPERVIALKNCPNLRHLFLSDPSYTILDEDDIRFLTQFTHLRSLSLTIALDDNHTAADLQLGTGFPLLEELWLDGDVSDVTKFICAARPTMLHSLETTIARSTDIVHLREYMSEIGAHLPSLRSLHMRVKEVSRAPQTALGDIIRPLYALKRIKEFGCDTNPCVLHTSDDDLRELAHAWPRLDWLRIGCLSPVGVRRASSFSRPSVRGLVELAQHCPHLKVIDLPALDVAQLPPPESVPVIGRLMTVLRLAWMPANSSPNANFNLAILLDRLFPKLEKFEVGEHGHPEEAGRNVYQYLEAMQAGRKHARLLAPNAEGEGHSSEEKEDDDDSDDEDDEHAGAVEEYDSDDSANP